MRASVFSVLDILDSLDAILARHDKVEQDHVGVERTRLEHGFDTVGRLADYLDAGLGFQ